MKILVLGSGVIGVSSAWYLNQAGHEVTVIDRQPGPAMETSFGNGGQISWGSAAPWAAPGIPWLALKWLFRPHSPLVLSPRLDPAMWRWLWQMLGNCRSARFIVNRERMLRLSRYSHECLVELRRQTGIEYDQGTRGTLIINRSQQGLDDAVQEARLLERLSIPYQLFDRAQCLAQEPALKRVGHKLVGGIYYPQDESGDCRKFTEALAQLAQKRGVNFLSGTTIESLVASGDRIEAVATSSALRSADAYLLACGSYSPLLLQPLGIRLPVYPVKGYSLTVPIADESAAPLGTITDETYKAVVTRLGDRIRAAGTAELAGYDLSLRPRRLATIEFLVRDLFPGAGDFTRIEHWCGLRPMTPDNPPVLGATPFKNLFLNTGHGTLGWTMACGSGRFLADLMSGVRPGIVPREFSLERYR
jgi:D-amino-acid dehydrogenase